MMLVYIALLIFIALSIVYAKKYLRLSFSHGVGDHIHVTPGVTSLVTKPNGKKVVVTEEDLKRQRELRQHVIKELVHTETVYVGKLKFLITSCADPLKDKPTAFGVTQDDLKLIFGSSLQTLVNLHVAFLDQLESCASSEDRAIGPSLHFLGSFLRVYTDYINNFEHSRSHLNKCKRKSYRFSKFLKNCALEEPYHLTVDAYLIEPIQRLPRYILLLKELQKYTRVDHKDFEDIKKALKSIKSIADLVNKRKRDSEAKNALNEIYHLVVPRQEDLIMPTRRLVQEGDFKLVQLKGTTRDADVDVHVCLFNDLILILQPEMDPSNPQLTLLHRLTLDMTMRIHDIDSTAISYGFELGNEGDMVILSAADQEEKNMWVKNIMTAKLRNEKEAIMLMQRSI